MLLFPTTKHPKQLNVTSEGSSGKLQSDCADQVNSDKETADKKKENTQHLCVRGPPASLHWHCVSRCVFFCGQCRDQLSILSVTVAGSPSGTARGGGLGGREAPVPVLHHTRVAVWVQDGAFTESTDCHLLPLLLPSRDAKEQHVAIYTVRKSMPVMTPV